MDAVAMRITRASLLTCRARRGTAALFLIVSSVVLFAAFALAVNHAWLSSIRVEVQTAADAAALAAAQSLVDDDTLRGSAALMPALFANATNEAAVYAAQNTVRGQPLALMENSNNRATGDIVFGMLATPKAYEMTRPDDLKNTSDQ